MGLECDHEPCRFLIGRTTLDDKSIIKSMGRRTPVSWLIALMGMLVRAAPYAPQAQTTEQSAEPGGVVQLTVLDDPAPDRVLGTVFGRAIVFDRDPAGTAWHALVGIDLDTKPGTYRVSLEAVREGRREPTATYSIRVITKRFPTRRLRVASEYVNPRPDDLKRIERDVKRLAALFDPVTPRHWKGSFVTPVTGQPTSNFGVRSIFNGQPRAPHAGIDFASPAGTPVRASNAGVIVLAEDLFFTGNTVVIDHGAGLYSLFAHLSTLAVAEGQMVDRGVVVGAVGATGRVTGAHLHWAIRLNGARVSPLSLLAVVGTGQVDGR